MEYSCKFRLYPNREQENLIARTFGCCRFVFNHYLAIRKDTYEQTGETVNYYACAKDMTGLKQQEETQCLKEVDATALQSALRDLDDAYKHFFRRMKAGEKKWDFPRFKNKHNPRQSYKSKCNGNTIKVLDGKHIRLPKLGAVRCAVSKQVQGRILSATVSRDPSGKYFVALCCTDVDIPMLPPTGSKVGVDIGVKDLAIVSDGAKYDNPKNYYKSQQKLARLQRQLSRKAKGSNNRKKAQLKVARLHEHIANQRKDAIHKMTSELVAKHDIICLEDLNAKGILRNHKMAKAVSDASFGEIRRQLEYKAAWHGKTVKFVSRWYPSSQLCHCCGQQNPLVKDLSIRTWVCPCCGAEHDRDINAAINIKEEGLRVA